MRIKADKINAMQIKAADKINAKNKCRYQSAGQKFQQPS